MDRFLGAFVEMGVIQPLLWTGAGARARGARSRRAVCGALGEQPRGPGQPTKV